MVIVWSLDVVAGVPCPPCIVGDSFCDHILGNSSCRAEICKCKVTYELNTVTKTCDKLSVSGDNCSVLADEIVTKVVQPAEEDTNSEYEELELELALYGMMQPGSWTVLMGKILNAAALPGFTNISSVFVLVQTGISSSSDVNSLEKLIELVLNASTEYQMSLTEIMSKVYDAAKLNGDQDLEYISSEMQNMVSAVEQEASVRVLAHLLKPGCVTTTHAHWTIVLQDTGLAAAAPTDPLLLALTQKHLCSSSVDNTIEKLLNDEEEAIEIWKGVQEVDPGRFERVTIEGVSPVGGGVSPGYGEEPYEELAEALLISLIPGGIVPGFTPCIADDNCTPVLHTVCANSYCQCEAGYTSDTSNVCVEGVMGLTACNAETSNFCSLGVNGSDCINGQCHCLPGYATEYSDRECTEVFLGTTVCSHILLSDATTYCSNGANNSACYNGICSCDEGYERNGSMCAQLTLNITAWTDHFRDNCSSAVQIREDTVHPLLNSTHSQVLVDQIKAVENAYPFPPLRSLVTHIENITGRQLSLTEYVSYFYNTELSYYNVHGDGYSSISNLAGIVGNTNLQAAIAELAYVTDLALKEAQFQILADLLGGCNASREAWQLVVGESLAPNATTDPLLQALIEKIFPTGGVQPVGEVEWFIEKVIEIWLQVQGPLAPGPFPKSKDIKPGTTEEPFEELAEALLVSLIPGGIVPGLTPCLTHVTCTSVPYAVCKDSYCQCDTGYASDVNNVCIEGFMGITLCNGQTTDFCSRSVSNSECSSDGTCRCEDGYSTEPDKRVCTDIRPGTTPCSHVSGVFAKDFYCSSATNSICVHGVCECAHLYNQVGPNDDCHEVMLNCTNPADMASHIIKHGLTPAFARADSALTIVTETLVGAGMYFPNTNFLELRLMLKQYTSACGTSPLLDIWSKVVLTAPQTPGIKGLLNHVKHYASQVGYSLQKCLNETHEAVKTCGPELSLSMEAMITYAKGIEDEDILDLLAALAGPVGYHTIQHDAHTIGLQHNSFMITILPLLMEDVCPYASTETIEEKLIEVVELFLPGIEEGWEPKDPKDAETIKKILVEAIEGNIIIGITPCIQNFDCTPAIGGSIVCAEGFCRCKKGFHEQPNFRQCTEIKPGITNCGPTYGGNFCATGYPNSVCAGGTCHCQTGYVPSVSECIEVLIGETSCVHDDYCSSGIEGSVCYDNTCECAENFRSDLTKRCTYGE